MKRLGQLIHTNNFGYEVYAEVARDMSSTRMSVRLYVLPPIMQDEEMWDEDEDEEWNVEMSEVFTIPKKNITRSQRAFDFILDLDGDFTQQDVDTIKSEVQKLLSSSNKNIVNTQKRATPKEVYYAIIDYIRDNAQDLEENSEADIFIKSEDDIDYGYVLTSKFGDFLAENKQLGVKKLDMLNELNSMGALRHHPSRAYDMSVRIKDGKIKRFYKIELTQTEAQWLDEGIE